MPLPRQLARLNRSITNQVTKRFAGWVPGFALVVHEGRRSGELYATPVNVFHHDGEYRFALTYGRNTDWVKNVVAAETFTIQTRGDTITLTEPVVLRDPAARWAPLGVRQVLNGIDAEYYLRCRAAS